jgi:hypothetical protein
MPPKFVRFGSILVLTLCLFGHVSEIFDHWDNTLQTGTDIDYGTVIVALIAGAVLGLVHVSVRALRIASGTLGCISWADVFQDSSIGPLISICHSPPRPLRI